MGGTVAPTVPHRAASHYDSAKDRDPSGGDAPFALVVLGGLTTAFGEPTLTEQDGPPVLRWTFPRPGLADLTVSVSATPAARGKAARVMIFDPGSPDGASVIILRLRVLADVHRAVERIGECRDR